MGPRLHLAIEPLESRNLLSADSPLSQVLSSDAALLPDAASGGAAAIPSIQRFLASTGDAAVDSGRWDWLAQTVWYVPRENLLAYATDTQLTTQTPLGDQTLWYVNQSSNGTISGETVAQLSISSSPSHMTFTGVVTDSGQIRMEFLSGGSDATATTGIGQMRLVQGAWRAEMQMVTGAGVLVTHWAYMSQLAADATPPDAGTPLPDTDLLSDEWRWLEGSHWAIADTDLFGGGAGVFAIDGYRNGYFWGSGTSSQPFNVMGSVTPEGNLLLLVSIAGSQPAVRTGMLQLTSSGGQMTLRTYEGQPAIGSAWTIAQPSAPGPIGPSLRDFLGSSIF